VYSNDTCPDTNTYVIDRAHQLRHRPIRRQRGGHGGAPRCNDGDTGGHKSQAPEEKDAKKCALQVHPLRIIIDIRLRQKEYWRGCGSDCQVHGGGMNGRLRRVVLVALLSACAAAVWTPAVLAGGQTQRKSHPTLKPLWSAFPLDRRQNSDRKQAVDDRSAQTQTPSAGGDSLGILPLVGAIALAMLVTGGIAALAVRRQLALPLVRRGVGSPKITVRLPFRPSEGGFAMSNARRRLWGRSDSDAPAEGGANAQRVVDRVSEYAAAENRPSTPSADQEVLDEPVSDEADAAKADVPTDLSAVGDEVASILKSAQEAAANIRRAALEEAAKRSDEVQAAVAAELGAARRAANADREEAHRVRAEADAYDGEIRAAADVYAEQRRAEAEREAGMIVAEARSRLEAADAEVERKLEKAEAQARGRVDMLKTEAERYEERLDNIFVVFREMSSQLEELLGAREVTTAESEDALEDALRPDPSSSRAA
jgi:hypothetical protein